MTTYWLLPEGRPRVGNGKALRELQIGTLDEMLCGHCGALLAVDHQLWDRTGGTLPSAGGTIICQLCGTTNDGTWVVAERPD